MTNSKIESDIGYIKNLVTKSGKPAQPASFYLLWAVIVAVGFSLIDFAPRWVGFFWMIAGTGGGLLSGYLGAKAGANRGQIDREIGIKHALHWSGMLAVIGLAVLLGVNDLVQGVVLSQVILLIAALGWWSAGVMFDRTFLCFGGIMMLGFVGTLIFDQYVWTALGVVLGLALTAVAIQKGRKNAG